MDKARHFELGKMKWLIFLYFLVLKCNIFTESAKPPHIVFILADDLGWNDVGYHGSEIKTPTIDQLADSGVKLERHYSQSTCTPSRGVLMTGRYQTNVGIHSVMQEGDAGGLPMELITLPEILRDVGYINHLVGKWHLGYSYPQYTPVERGFHTMRGLYTSARDHFTYQRCMTDAKGQQSCGIDYHNDITGNHSADFSAAGTFSAQLQSRHAIDLIHKHNQSQPMFLYLAYSAPHFPVQAPREYVDMYPGIKDEQRRTYAGMVTCMDDGIKSVLQALVDTGMWESTLLVFTSDNGGSATHGASNSPLREGKGTVFEGGIRVPALMAGPLVPDGVTFNGLVHLSDWFPTLTHLAGADVSHIYLDGINLWPSISNSSQYPTELGESTRNELVVNINPQAPLVGENLYPNLFDVRVSSAIISNEWKLVTGNPVADKAVFYASKGNVYKGLDEVVGDRNIFLFNIVRDPNEENEVSAENTDIVIMLLNKLKYYKENAAPSILFEKDLEGANPKNHGGAWMPWRGIKVPIWKDEF